MRERIAEVLADLSESLGGIRVITAFNRRRHNITAHRNIVGSYRDANIYTAHVGAIYGPATDMVGVLGQLVVLAVGGNMVLNGTLTIGGLTAFVLYLTAFFAPIQQLVQLYTTYQSARRPSPRSASCSPPSRRSSSSPHAVVLPPIEGRIELRGVGFALRARPAVLHDVDLRHRSPARRSPSSARPAPASPPWPS